MTAPDAIRSILAVEEELSELARDDPERALASCAALAEHQQTVIERSVLARLRGTALRVLGRVEDAGDCLVEAVSLAEQAGDSVRLGRARSALGVVHAYGGRFDEAVASLESARDVLTGTDRVDVDLNLAGVHARLGDVAAARALLDGAVATCEDGAWGGPLADALTNRGLLASYTGDLDGARDDLERALATFETVGNSLGVAQTQHNLGFVAGRRGDLRSALDWFARSDDGLKDTDAWADTVMTFGVAEALLASGLSAEAADRAALAARTMEEHGATVDADEARLLQAHALARDEQFSAAEQVAADAASRFAEQGRLGWASEAGVVVGRCALAQGDVVGAIVLLRRLVDELDGYARGEAWREAALLLADALVHEGETGPGDDDSAATSADELLEAIGVGELPLHHAALRDLIRTRRLAANSEHAAAVDLARTTLREHAAVRATLDAVDIRAGMGVHTRAMRQLARQSAVAASDHEALHELAEWGALSTLEPPPMSPPDDSEAASLLSELRHATADLRDAQRDLEPADDLAVVVARLQREVADAMRRLSGNERRAIEPIGVEEVMARLGGRSYVRFITVGEELHRLVVVDGGLRHDTVASVAEVVGEAKRLAGGLAREIRGSRSARAVEAARRGVDASAELLGVLLFSGIDDRLADDVVVVGPAELDTLAWQLLPPLRGRAVTVAPAAGLIGDQGPGGAGSPAAILNSVVLVAGPGLDGAVTEIERLSAVHASATVLVGERSAASAVRSAMTGADLVHVAAHARLERGQPLLSSIELADGPLYVHDLFAVTQPPAQVIFSACESARGSDVLGGEILGLASALLTRGTAAVLGTKVPLPDNEPTHEAVERIHRRLLEGETMAQALGGVANGDDQAARVAGAMVVLGR